MENYFKVPKDSETGRKFQALRENREAALNAWETMGKKYGFQEVIEPLFGYGGFACGCVFYEEPDLKIWEKMHKDNREKRYTPRLSHPKGRAIQKEFDSMPIEESCAADKLVGCEKGDLVSQTLKSRGDYFLFRVESYLEFEDPDDCIEIPETEYYDKIERL